MKGIKLQPREKVIVTIAILAAIFYLFFNFWYKDYGDKIAAAKTQVDSLDKQISDLNNLLAGASKLTEPKAKQAIELEGVDVGNRLPDLKSLPEVMNNLKTVIEANRGSVVNISFDKNNAKKPVDPTLDFKVMKVTLRVASYNNLDSIVKSVEYGGGKENIVNGKEINRTFTIEELTVTRDKEAGMNATMTVDVYFSKNPIVEYKPQLEQKGKWEPFL